MAVNHGSVSSVDPIRAGNVGAVWLTAGESFEGMPIPLSKWTRWEGLMSFTTRIHPTKPPKSRENDLRMGMSDVSAG
jgi:hypothetical protein